MRVCIALIALMLVGCGASDHSRFYVLTENPAVVARAVAAPPTTTIALGAVKLPAIQRAGPAVILGIGDLVRVEAASHLGSVQRWKWCDES
jgi:hypothetical protein